MMISLDLSNDLHLNALVARLAPALAAAMAKPEPVEITYKEAAEKIGCSKETIERRIKAMRLRTYRKGRQMAFDRKYLDRVRYY